MTDHMSNERIAELAAMQPGTPGPWRVSIDDDGNPLSGRPSVQASEEMDCGIVHWDGFVQTYWRSARGDKEIHANACLIAAAPEAFDALRQTLADLAQAEATIAERDAEIARLRALLADWRGKISGPGVDMQTLLHRTDEALKEAEHD